MCTVTVVRSGDLLRVACNRDELRVRPEAHAPFITIAGGVQALMPQDPQGRGTWIGANASGLVFALLNKQGTAREPISRGVVIPALLGSESPEDAVTALRAMPLEGFAPFRLLVVAPRTVIECAVEEGDLYVTSHRLLQPLLFTSSSLGDALVDGPRRLLFEQMFGTPWDLPAQQDAYHRHRWSDRPAVSVHMSRHDACTASTTTVEVTPTQVRMTYEPAHCLPGVPVGLFIDRIRVARTDSEALLAATLAS
jgi:hypothetical protein